MELYHPPDYEFAVSPDPMNFTRQGSRRRSQLKRQLHQLIVARSDVTAARKMAEMLLKSDEREDYAFIGNDIYPACFHAIVVSYARPFTQSKEIGALPSKWSQFSNIDMKKTHDLLIETRNTIVAHNDPVGHHVEIIPPGYKALPGGEASEFISLQIARDYFNRSYFQSIHRLCHYQLVELNKAIDELLEKLYGGLDLPTVPFPLRLDEGL